MLDLDAAGFRVAKRVSLKKVKPIGITLVVKNGGSLDSPANATVVGVQNGVEVYNESRQVSDGLGNGRTAFEFPAYTPGVVGDIMWTVTIADDDPDVDLATATTKVVP